jgi:dipeptidyl-peptidase-4
MRLLVIPALIQFTAIAASHADEVLIRMDQAQQKGEKFNALMREAAVRPFWSTDEKTFFFRTNNGSGGHQFVSVDLKTGSKSAAFAHDLMAKALAGVSGKTITSDILPIDYIESTQDGNSLRMLAMGKAWRFNTVASSLTIDDLPLRPLVLLTTAEAFLGTKQWGAPADITISNKTKGDIEIYWVDGKGKWQSHGKLESGQLTTRSSYIGHVWIFTDAQGKPLAGARVAPFSAPAVIIEGLPSSAPLLSRRGGDISPDGRWKAVLSDHNLSIVPSAGGEPVFQTRDGSPDDHWDRPIQWSPDSKKVVVFRTREVTRRKIHIVKSSPLDRVQPELLSFDYEKPGDPIKQSKPRLIHVGKRAEIPVKDALFDNPWLWWLGDQSEWSLDSKEFFFLYNQRGHQVMRIVGVDSESGIARSIHEERSNTFIDYSQKTFLKWLPESREILWASERDGHNHLYLLDQVAGKIRNPITRGDGNLREVIDTDVKNRTLLVKINGIGGQDPYHDHFARVSFDGSTFTRLTDGDGTHRIEISPDKRLLLDTWSRVDHVPVMELRDAKTGRKIAELARGDDSAMVKSGWSKPERFVAKGRDGKTDIHGVLYRPSNFDPTRKYPVLEDIYASPQNFSVPKDFAAWRGMNQMAELGFIVVSIDGMGSNWRNKAFHDVCWKNLMDSGFPDRIPWIKAAAATRPWMDLTRVGVHGGSAGGQNALAGLLNHGDFYKVGVADCGCHDNRMDKIWWNEAWMGWPVDDSYAKNSNVTHAAKLTGKLLLIVGELDTNVDPASTAQVAAALQRAGKFFEYVPIMNAGHGAAEITSYGRYRRAEFLLRNLQDMRAN